MLDISGRLMSIDTYKFICAVDHFRQDAERMCKPFKCVSDQAGPLLKISSVRHRAVGGNDSYLLLDKHLKGLENAVAVVALRGEKSTHLGKIKSLHPSEPVRYAFGFRINVACDYLRHTDDETR
ncbi:hypothetical protein [Hyphomicrobium denitrificans]|uniref:hypothetical protein n=1 Tax=Hyphomicrobium denitrificans TaxID=53399 RepID=UPI001231E5B2|nr:hypothetical protein [Hyphomicrobium denitrificans]